MGKDNDQNLIKETPESDLGLYEGLRTLGYCILNAAEIPLQKGENEPHYEIISPLAHKIAGYLPIEGGYGKTIIEQVDLWESNPNVFTDYFNRRHGAVNLVDERNRIINRKRTNEHVVSSIELEKAKLGKRGQFTQEQVLSLQKLNNSLLRDRLALAKTQIQFQDDREMRKALVAGIDCKLPVVVLGLLLSEIGWKVGMSSWSYPEHPFLIASNSLADGISHSYAVSFTGRGSRFKSDEHVVEIGIEHLRGSQIISLKNGFITGNDPWPLPFNNVTFRRYDDWYSRDSAERNNWNRSVSVRRSRGSF